MNQNFNHGVEMWEGVKTYNSFTPLTTGIDEKACSFQQIGNNDIDCVSEHVSNIEATSSGKQLI